MKPSDQNPHCFPICCCKFISEQKLGSSVNLWYIEIFSMTRVINVTGDNTKI